MLSLIPWDAFFGGMLLGVSALVLRLGIGRVAGISGIVSRLLPIGTSNKERKDADTANTEKHWRIAFAVGMWLAGRTNNTC